MNMPVGTLVDPIAEHAQAMLLHLGEEIRRPGLRDTPKRFAEARHLCMAMRGVEKQHSTTATRALRGVYAHDVHARQEILPMIQER